MSRLFASGMVFWSLTFVLEECVQAEPPEAKRQASEAASPPRLDRYGDPLPPGAIARLGTLRWRHAGPINSIAFSPTGQTLASGGSDGTVRLWEVPTGRQLFKLPLEKGGIKSLAFSPDGKWLAADAGPAVHFCDAATGRPLFQLPVPGTQVTFAPDGTILAAISAKGVSLWNVTTRTLQRGLETDQQAVFSLAFSPNGKLLATGGSDKSVCLWEVATGKLMHRLPADTSPIRSLAFSPDGATLAAAGGSVCLWRVSDGKLLDTYSSLGRCVAFSPNGQLIASVGRGLTVRLWHVSEKREVGELRGHEGHITSLAFSPDGKLLASAGLGGAIRVWEVAACRELDNVPGHETGVGSVAFLNGRTIVTGTLQKIHIWELMTTKRLRRIEPGGPLLAVSPDGKMIAWGSIAPFGIHVWDMTLGVQLATWPERAEVQALAFSPDGKDLAYITYHGRISIWQIAGKQQLNRSARVLARATSLGYSSDKNTLVIAGTNGEIQFWSAANGEELLRFPVASSLPDSHHHPAFVDLSSDGRTVVSAHGSSGIHFWEVPSGRDLVHLRQPAHRLALSPGSRLLATTSHRDGTIRILEAATGEAIAQLRGQEGRITALAFAPDSKSLATASMDNTVLIWDLLHLSSSPGRLPAALDDKQLEHAWAALAGKDAATAYHTICSLVSTPEQALGLLRERLQPIPVEGSDRIKQWIIALDNDTFSVREQSFQELEKLGYLAEPEIREALQGQTSLQARQSLHRLLDALERHPPPDARLREIRAVQVLELIGSPDAQEFLGKLARGKPSARLTEDARTAFTRLGRQLCE